LFSATRLEEQTSCFWFDPGSSSTDWLPWNSSLIAYILNLLIYLFIGGTAVWTQGFTLAMRPPYAFGYFGDEVSQTICLGCPWIMILLILASQIARITGLSHQLAYMLMCEQPGISFGCPCAHYQTNF
jgi:hypothetical protein